MAGVNKAILLGHLGKDPKVTTTQSGSRIVSFSLATSESWKDKATGERKERTSWHQVVIFNEPIGKIAETYLRKGHQVYLEGTIETRKWTDQGGVEKYQTEIVLRQFRGELTLLDKSERPTPSPESYGAQRATPAATSRPNDPDDEIPF